MGSETPDPSTTATAPSAVLACPHCEGPLQLNGAGATCENRHSFDRGRGGYLNLLVGGRLSGATTPGDTPDALAARRRFLAGGDYTPIVTALAEAIGVPGGPVLDVGCGEGYYLSQLPLPDRFGLDIAKRAVQMAAMLLPDTQFVVGSAYRLPVLDQSVATVLSVFAPHPFEEFERVLQPGGRWVTVTPGPNHLREMRPALSGESGRKAGDRLERRSEPPGEATAAIRVEFQLQLSADARRDLFLMTPLRWQAGAIGAATEHGGEVHGGEVHGGEVQGGAVSVDVWVSSSAR